MTDMSVARTGYSSRRSPGAFAAAALFNGGLIGLLIAIPVTFIAPPRGPTTTIYDVPVDVPPPPRPDEPKPKPEIRDVQRTTMDPPQPQPTATDIFVDLNANPPFTGTIAPPVFPVGGEIAPKVQPAAPVLVKARPDPRFADAFRPDYPPAMRREGLEGAVTVRVTIDARGRVTGIELVRADNPLFFEETRRQALKSWRFVPATRDGVAVDSEQTMTVRFKLEE